mmetsp:Transcript_14717/g.31660  ORF Transcript_14717/g.31660 Transcript_14717/m.31660 type:complete len:1277 (-) Transcript_14717:127-3957(-)
MPINGCPTMNFPASLLLVPYFTLLLLSLFTTNHVVSALHADEAGLNDFLLKSAGHGDVGVTYSHLVSMSHDSARHNNEKVWVTSQSGEYPAALVDDVVGGGDVDGDDFDGGRWEADDYCAVAARNVTTGNVLWRANACSSSSGSGNLLTSSKREFVPRHATLASVYLTIFSLDNTGILRGWNSLDGALVLDTDILANIDAKNENGFNFPGSFPRLLDAQLAIGTVVTKENGGGGQDDESLVLLDTAGQPIKEEGYHHQQSTSLLSARELLGKAKVSGKRHGRARILDMHLLDEASARFSIWVGWSTDNEGKATGSFSSMAFVEVALTPKPASDGRIVMVYQIVRALPLNMLDVSAVASTPVLLSSLRMVHSNDQTVSMLAISSSSTQVVSVAIDISTAKAKYGQVVEIDVLHPYWRSISSIHVDNTKAVVDTDTSAGKETSYHVVRVAGLDDRYLTLPRRTESLLLLDGSIGQGNNALLHRVYGKDEEAHHDALAYCADSRMVVAASQDDGGGTVASSFLIESEALRQNSHKVTWSMPRTVEGDAVIAPPSRGALPGLVKYAHLAECSAGEMTVVFTTIGGMTTAFRFESTSDSNSDLRIDQLWSSEEALGSISSSIFLDETHALTDEPNGSNDALAGGNADDEEEKALRNLQFVHRIQSQVSSFKGFVSDFVLGGGALSSLASLVLLSDEKKKERGVAFGFAKISVLLSERLHRLVALDTARKGRVVWSMNLHPRASWHSLVHGGQFMSLNHPHGNGGVHDHEMLALSYVGDDGTGAQSSFVEWNCFDGLSGRVFSSEIVAASSTVVQIAPLRPSVHHPREAKSCRQVALLIHSDQSVSVVPDTAQSYAIVDEAVSAAGRNGLFVHTVDKKSGEFHALRVSRKSGSKLSPNPFELVTVGTTIFDPSQENIVNIAYPRRGEVIQSPSTVLGDDALLLKYLNPHLIVVVTEATKSFLEGVAPMTDGSDETGNGFYNALVGGQYSGSSSSGQKRKPIGASKPGTDAALPANSSANAATPSLFISLVDSVSGQILHRVSHAHALASDLAEGAVSTRVPVVISENWVVYTFFNQRTRRTDVGVLTLHEGMIDKNGITAFSAPEQEVSFSSLESAKPIVLSKTFGLAKAVTAVGVTTTKAGISSKLFLFGTANDQVVSIDRRMLDPRRPNGELKETEKMEGLIRYSPLLPIVPLKTPSHTYEVSSVQSISSAPANVESQSLVLAYGGPDVFFTRLAPSKGFDLLPDDFNRGLLSVVLVGLIVLLNVIQRMNKKKMVTTVWS